MKYFRKTDRLVILRKRLVQSVLSSIIFELRTPAYKRHLLLFLSTALMFAELRDEILNK